MKITSLILLLFLSTLLTAQTDYAKAWKALDEAQVEKAITHFNLALKDKSTRAKAQLCLTLIYSQRNRQEKASDFFHEFLDESKDPYAELYALWFENGVTGSNGKKYPYQEKTLKRFENQEDNLGKLDAAVNYRLLSHYTMSFDLKNTRKYFNKLNYIEDWQMLGPFDNVMNSGFDKDFGALKSPQSDAKFTSKYGADISWFTPIMKSEDGYIFKDQYFRSSNSLIYAQTFLEVDEAQDVIIKFGYSGSLKIWINDELLYQENEHRRTELDFYRFNCKLNKGYNRILIQLGDYNESNANFSIRVTDPQNKPLDFSSKTDLQKYEKKLSGVKQIPYFAIEQLKAKVEKEDDYLYSILLAKAYMRSNELNEAEAILKDMIEQVPKNYFALRNIIDLSSRGANRTNQNKYYDLFKENYPEDKYVLENDIEEAIEKKDKVKAKSLISTYLSKYGTSYYKIKYEIQEASMDNDNEKVIELIEKLYDKNPDNFEAATSKYRLEKEYYAKPEKANKILEKYLKNNYSYDIIKELAYNYSSRGEIDKAIKLLRKGLVLVPYTIESFRFILNIYIRQSKYDKGIELVEKLLVSRPSDYLLLEDMAYAYTYKNDKAKAISYYEKALDYYPFAFETNEKIRELTGQTKAIDLLPKFRPTDLIADYEANFKTKIKQSYDVIAESMSKIIFESKATATVHKYIIKMNDEKAIERFQNISFSTGGYSDFSYDEVKTIKKNGQSIDAERNSNQVVFTNLEVGDYIYVSYNKKQYRGGKSSLFISDRFSLNSYSPYYKTEYNLLVENDLPIKYDLINGSQKPEISKEQGFTKYQWAKTNPEIIKTETYPIPFFDIGKVLHVSLDYDWKDIVQWYSDLTTSQAAPDFTIKQIVSELFDGKNLSQEEKAKTIYEFVCKNIQYSFVDFRQSGYIPQKASQIYHARLGDCKDVSTLYVSIARAAGLKANLVLINTRDNGQKHVVLPSLNFNHCIVKVYLDEGDKYLELTDKDLPYGQLYYYHDEAAILEIPSDGIIDDVQLSYLKPNVNFQAKVIRNTKVNINADNKMNVKVDAVKMGTAATNTIRNYYYEDIELRKDNLKQVIAPRYKSTVSLKSLDYEILAPRRDTIKYSYAYVVDNDILKLGSLKTFKIPFADKLIQMSIFEDEERTHNFNYIYYEDTDWYEEILMLELDEKLKYKEVPENVKAEYLGSVYELKFKKINDKQMEVKRTFKVNRKNIEAKDFEGFKDFMNIVNEGENTHVLFQ